MSQEFGYDVAEFSVWGFRRLQQRCCIGLGSHLNTLLEKNPLPSLRRLPAGLVFLQDGGLTVPWSQLIVHRGKNYKLIYGTV